jgi:hypothetical protein
MARKPNYDFERLERDKAKAAKKAAKADARAVRKDDDKPQDAAESAED